MRIKEIITVALIFAGWLYPNTASACSATFFERSGLRGQALTRYGPDEIYDVDVLRYSDGSDLGGDIRSVEAGPDTIVELYDNRGLRDLRYVLRPREARNVRGIDSYRIVCRPRYHGEYRYDKDQSYKDAPYDYRQNRYGYRYDHSDGPSYQPKYDNGYAYRNERYDDQVDRIESREQYDGYDRHTYRERGSQNYDAREYYDRPNDDPSDHYSYVKPLK